MGHEMLMLEFIRSSTYILLPTSLDEISIRILFFDGYGARRTISIKLLQTRISFRWNAVLAIVNLDLYVLIKGRETFLRHSTSLMSR